MSLSLVRDDQPAIRLLDASGNLLLLIEPDSAQTVLDTGAYVAVRRRERIRALKPAPGREEEAAAIAEDLDQLQSDAHSVTRPGYSHMLERWDNPKGVVTISRIPVSLRPIFTSVLDSVKRAA